MLKKVYYDEGMPFGRDALFEVVKSRFPEDFPGKRYILRWLKEQEVQQLFTGQRKGGSVDTFRANKPWSEISADLIDFTNKRSANYRYILVVIDNFSRYMFAEAITSKESLPNKNGKREGLQMTSPVGKGMEIILNNIKKDFNAVPKSVLTDDGSEFKGEFLTLLKQRGIRKKRTLGGQPQSNGLVERANGKVKMIMKKNVEINGGNWSGELQRSVKAYNNQFIRTTQAFPKDAVNFKTEQQQKTLRDNIKGSRKEQTTKFERREDYKIGDEVRVKLAKGKLSKQSDQSWSSTIYKIGHIIPKRGTIAEKYLIAGKAQDQQYSRNDILKVNSNKLQGVPTKTKERRERVKIKDSKQVMVRSPKESRKKTKVVKEFPAWRKNKVVFAKYPIESSGKRKKFEWYKAKVMKREDQNVKVIFDLDNIEKVYSLRDFKQGVIQDTMPEDFPAVNSTISGGR